ncbi:type II toxin-antitoxin system death-on-curing family toxin [Methanoregula sp.]|uniref:type II toxin-antitoxin system death-on-curing family toxin n=1 Tax=Methanoregula sp. TaxID=2052170 RepID=UPI003BB08087
MKAGILSEKEITAREIIEIHADILRDFGGTSGIRDTGTLDYVIYQVNRSRKVIRKSSIILHGIATGHPFVDGNKRTAFVAADNLVRDQGYLISATDEEVVSFMIEVAEYKHTRESVETWLKEKTGL